MNWTSLSLHYKSFSRRLSQLGTALHRGHAARSWTEHPLGIRCQSQMSYRGWDFGLCEGEEFDCHRLEQKSLSILTSFGKKKLDWKSLKWCASVAVTPPNSSITTIWQWSTSLQPSVYSSSLALSSPHHILLLTAAYAATLAAYRAPQNQAPVPYLSFINAVPLVNSLVWSIFTHTCLWQHRMQAETLQNPVQLHFSRIHRTSTWGDRHLL